MAGGRGSSGRGGGQIGRGKALTREEKEEARRHTSNAARIRTSYGCTIYGKPVLPALKRQESAHWKAIEGAASSPGSIAPSPGTATSSSRADRPVKMEVDDAVPRFAPEGYVDNADLDKIVAFLAARDAIISPDDSVHEHNLGPCQYRRIQAEQDNMYVDLVSDEE